MDEKYWEQLEFDFEDAEQQYAKHLGDIAASMMGE